LRGGEHTLNQEAEGLFRGIVSEVGSYPQRTSPCGTHRFLGCPAMLFLFKNAASSRRAIVRIGVALICLLVKADGGLKPNWLLPTIIRVWMRMHLNIARA